MKLFVFLDIAELLIQHHAHVNDPGGQHCGNITPLHDASQNGHIEIVQILVKNGGSICAKTKEVSQFYTLQNMFLPATL